jgi:hypothetical protein
MKPFLIIVLVVFISGCKSTLPSDTTRANVNWETYKDCEDSFDQIIPYKTTVEELKDIGFDPYKSSNIKVLTYLDIIQRFIPNSSISKADLPDSIFECLKAKDSCVAYEVTLENREKKRVGNAWLDILGFKKKTHITGWVFKALIIVNKDMVVYKLRAGEPNINYFEEETRPLGPLQEINLDAPSIPL